MNLNQIESFIAASEQQNLRRAAESLGVTQPTLSARIRVLEEQLGEQLFDRTTVGVELTEAGRRWLPHARTMINAWDNGTRALSVASGLKGRKCFGLHEYLVPGYTAPIMAALQSVWPDHAIHLPTQVSAELVERVVAGTLDAALIYDSRPHRDVAFHLIWKQEIELYTTGDAHDPATEYVDIDWGAEFPAFQQQFLSGRLQQPFPLVHLRPRLHIWQRILAAPSWTNVISSYWASRVSWNALTTPGPFSGPSILSIESQTNWASWYSH